MGLFEEYTFYVDHTQRLSERRQTATQTFLTINTAIFTILAFLFKDAGFQARQLVPVSLPLFVAGLLVCWLWRRILLQYKELIGWRYKQLRAIEQQLPDSYRMLSKEWDEYYKPRDGKPGFNFTNLEQQLPVMFSGLYAAGLALMLAVLAGWI